MLSGNGKGCSVNGQGTYLLLVLASACLKLLLHSACAIAEFNPDRFPVDRPMPNEVTENFAFLPFGGGKRKCIGDQFALFESVVALAMLVRRFDFTTAPGAPEVGMTTGKCAPHQLSSCYPQPRMH